MTPHTDKAVYKTPSPTLVRALEGNTPEFVVTFTEDVHGFYVNDKKYSATDGPHAHCEGWALRTLACRQSLP